MNLQQEIEEAIEAGERALFVLRKARGYLDSAGTWGIIDIFGGGFITDIIKHSKMHEAQEAMEVARNEIRHFKQELDDIDDYIPDIYIGDFVTLADFLFDGFITDLFVQSKIENTKRQVDDSIHQVESVLNKLRRAV